MVRQSYEFESAIVKKCKHKSLNTKRFWHSRSPETKNQHTDDANEYK